MPVSTAVLAQRAGGGARGVAFGPNLGSIDYRDLFSEPHSWAALRDQLSGFKIYGENVLADSPSDKVGGNAYPALREAGVFSLLHEWGLPIHLEHGALKEWEKPEDPPGQALRLDTLKALQRVRDAGGDVALVAMDEPLLSKVNSGGDQDPRRWGIDRVGDAARYTADYMRALMQEGPRVGLIEAYPYHPADRIDAFVRHIVDDNDTPLAFFELDIDLFDVRNKKLKEAKLAADLQAFAQTCSERSIPFRLIVTGTHARTSKEYQKEAFDIVRLARQARDQWDGVTVQSWTDHDSRREIPRNRPLAEATSHLGILSEVLRLGIA